MESKQILDIFEQFNENNTYKKIFINGSWGIGKSFYTNKYKNDYEDFIIYISLFGKTSFEMILDTLSDEILKKLNNIEKFNKIAKKIAKNFQCSISIHSISISSPAINNKTIFEEFDKNLKEKELIIIFDDLERKSPNVPIEDIMGLIEQFSLLKKIKIAVIGDESNINDKEEQEKWNKFKEKIIEKEYKIISFSNEAIESIVINGLRKYISKEKLNDFITKFLAKHKISNLRTINKGINLFIEIIKNNLSEEYEEKVYLTILKNCVAVVIEYNEELYKPKEEDKNSKDISKHISYELDKNIETRIYSHYFNSLFMNNKDSSILKYIISIYNGDTDKTLEKEFNNVLKNYISKDEEKNIFYLSEKKIKKKVTKIYNDIMKKNYKFSTIEEFISEINNLLIWNKELSLNLNISEINIKIKKILFTEYYDVNKEQYKNQIDQINIRFDNTNELLDIISDYNEDVDKRYVHDKIDMIVDEYMSNDYNTKYLEWLKYKLTQSENKETMNYFMECCRNNNYFIPDLSTEINENIWNWTYYIWDIFYKRMDQNSKKELNDYAENLKKISNIVKYRVTCLQKSKPLIQNVELNISNYETTGS